MDLSIKGQLKKFKSGPHDNHSAMSQLNSWIRRDILVVTNKTEDIVRMFGDHVIVLSENEYVPPVMRIGKVYAAAYVKLTSTAWWDDLRLRAIDKAIHLL